MEVSMSVKYILLHDSAETNKLFVSLAARTPVILAVGGGEQKRT
jgi:hypothetical protein